MVGRSLIEISGELPPKKQQSIFRCFFSISFGLVIYLLILMSCRYFKLRRTDEAGLANFSRFAPGNFPRSLYHSFIINKSARGGNIEFQCYCYYTV